MPLAVSEDHDELQRTIRRWLETYCQPDIPRAVVEGDAGGVPGIWKQIADQGWLGLHVDEAFGGQGFGFPELAIVLEEFGASLVPGPVLSTVVVSSVVQRVLRAHPDRTELTALLEGLSDGSLPAGLSFGSESLRLESGSMEAGVSVSGTIAPVLGAPSASIYLVPVAELGWILVSPGDGVSVEILPALDATRTLGALTLDNVSIPAQRCFGEITRSDVTDIALVLSAAESTGSARWCLETTSAYATTRVQFGRPIGQFQAVKHRLADMLVQVEQSTAVAWDGARSEDDRLDERQLVAAITGSIVIDGFVECAKSCVQLHGGIGFTWEHDAHLYFRRALATQALLGSSDIHSVRVEQLVSSGVRRSLSSDLPAEAEEIRGEIEPLVAQAKGLKEEERRDFLIETGLSVPHWPRPWGREASPLEQIVIQEEMTKAHVVGPHLSIGGWALPTIITHGTSEQQERWVRPTLRGEMAWCQLFSEPGAGSDLASLSMKAEKVEGGYSLTGQKVWTSMARQADVGICLARTDSSGKRHDGITYFIVDMKSEGIEIRPLRELTGDAMFNEVFFTNVFVPDDTVIGAVGDGWKIARTTLDNERVFMSTGSSFGIGVEQVVDALGKKGEQASVLEKLAVGGLLAEAQSIAIMGQRATLLSLSGLEVGANASVRKLLGAEHEQRVQQIGLGLTGAMGAVADGEAAAWSRGTLFTRCLTIAGGTSEVQRNVIAERLLGQPKDPEPGE